MIRSRAQVDDDPVLRHIPYFGDEDKEEFDYLNYYDSTTLLSDTLFEGIFSSFLLPLCCYFCLFLCLFFTFSDMIFPEQMQLKIMLGVLTSFSISPADLDTLVQRYKAAAAGAKDKARRLKRAAGDDSSESGESDEEGSEANSAENVVRALAKAMHCSPRSLIVLCVDWSRMGMLDYDWSRVGEEGNGVYEGHWFFCVSKMTLLCTIDQS